ncbi:MAG: hypothetical protein DMF74_28275 [Acidobacteria bacterium]|nr:MAG: hypothetical protein DMF74_28275 [Acidobacteriota bacterium]
MTLEGLIQSDLWREFEEYARSRRRQPARLLAELMREQLEIAADVALNNEIRRDVQKSGYKEKDAVRIVREYRAEKRKRRAAS